MDEERKSKINKQVKMILALKFKKDDPIPAEISPGVFIGSIGSALNKNYLLSNRITHILIAADNMNPSFPEMFQYKNLEITDTSSTNIMNFFQDAIEYIDSSLRTGGKILVHCFAGRSRSAAICCAYLIKKNGLSLEQALKEIKEKRPCVMPNPGFLFQLQLFEKNWRILDFSQLN